MKLQPIEVIIENHNKLKEAIGLVAISVKDLAESSERLSNALNNMNEIKLFLKIKKHD